MTARELLISGASELGLNMTDASADKLMKYLQMIEEKNSVMNLTAIRDTMEAVKLHFLDALGISSVMNLSGQRVIDVGCGLGIPGMALKLYDDSIDLTLLDSLGKRIDFLKEVCTEVGVEVECVHARAEEFVRDRRESYDIAVSRAVAELNVLCELVLPYVKVGGIFCAMKSSSSADELDNARNAIKTLGGKLLDTHDYKVPHTDVTHRLLIIEKIESTDMKYPRKFARISKNPL